LPTYLGKGAPVGSKGKPAQSNPRTKREVQIDKKRHREIGRSGGGGKRSRNMQNKDVKAQRKGIVRGGLLKVVPFSAPTLRLKRKKGRIGKRGDECSLTN